MPELHQSPGQALAALARANAGVFTAAQALACGMPRDQLLQLVRRGVWQTLHHEVHVAAGTPLTTAVQEAAALALLGPSAVLSHASAARRHGLDVPRWEGRVYVTLPFASHYPSRPGLVVMRTRHPTPAALIGGARVTALPRTLVDLARDLELSELRAVLADAVRRRRVTLERVLSAAEGLGGRAGLRVLRLACDELDPLLESVLEQEALPHLLAVGLPELVRQYEVRGADGLLIARLDFACLQLKLGIEVDGWAFHSSPADRNRDVRRDRILTARGWTVVRVTTDDVRRRPYVMITELRDVVAALLSPPARSLRAAQ